MTVTTKDKVPRPSPDCAGHAGPAGDDVDDDMMSGGPAAMGAR
jgi:hypothetical protein